jgi:hypothetical protein
VESETRKNNLALQVKLAIYGILAVAIAFGLTLYMFPSHEFQYREAFFWSSSFYVCSFLYIFDGSVCRRGDTLVSGLILLGLTYFFCMRRIGSWKFLDCLFLLFLLMFPTFCSI